MQPILIATRCQRGRIDNRALIHLLQKTGSGHKWVHTKLKVVEPEGLLGAYEFAKRVCGLFDCPHDKHLTVAFYIA